MKLADKYLPPLPDGEYTVHVTQSIETSSPCAQEKEKQVAEQDVFEITKDFQVISRAFTLPQDDVFSIYPAEHAQGDFSGEVPFLVSGAKTLPWLYGDGRLPWVALIAVNENDMPVVEQDITIRDLLSNKNDKLYFPASAMPSNYVEKPEDSCHVVDLPIALFQDIMPKQAETEYLCHARYVNLADTVEDISGMDGYFSVVIGNRFLSEGQTTVHLVSTLGYPDYDNSSYNGYSDVRLISLYHWNVFCEPRIDMDFADVISHLSCGSFQGDSSHILSEQGVCAKVHYTRAGDRTGSLYHSPLVPYCPDTIPQIIQPCHSADSVLIYDSGKGLFDVTYAAAWQFGKMLALSKEQVAKAIVGCRTRIDREHRQNKMQKLTDHITPDYTEVCMELNNLWKKDARGIRK